MDGKHIASSVWNGVVGWIRQESAAATALVQAFIALGIAFAWWNWNNAQTGAVFGIVSALLGMFVRSQVTPLVRPRSSRNFPLTEAGPAEAQTGPAGAPAGRPQARPAHAASPPAHAASPPGAEARPPGAQAGPSGAEAGPSTRPLAAPPGGPPTMPQTAPPARPPAQPPAGPPGEPPATPPAR